MGNHHPLQNQKMADTPEAPYFNLSSNNPSLPLCAAWTFMFITALFFFSVHHPSVQPSTLPVLLIFWALYRWNHTVYTLVCLPSLDIMFRRFIWGSLSSYSVRFHCTTAEDGTALPVVCLLTFAMPAQQRPSWIVVTKTTWLAKPKTLTIWPLADTVCWLLQGSVPLCEYTTVHLSCLLFLDTWAVHAFRLLQMMLLWTFFHVLHGEHVPTFLMGICSTNEIMPSIFLAWLCQFTNNCCWQSF